MESPEGQTGSSGRVNAYTLSLIEQKFQHFLNATVRAGSVYGGCGGENGTWAWDAAGHWVVRRQPHITFGCSCFAAAFLTYWYNYNGAYHPGWDLGVWQINHAFDQSIERHDVDIPHRRRYTGLRGFREFVVDASRQPFYGGNFMVSRVSPVAAYINDGWLLLSRKAGGNYYFKWHPDVLGDFNVVGVGGHHVIMYVKRGSGGENDPPEDGNRPHQVWRLAADGTPGSLQATTWREEELQVVLCPAGHRHTLPHNRHRSGVLMPPSPTVALSERSLAAEPDLRGLQGQRVTLYGERDRHACGSMLAIWKLMDLRPHTRAPLIETYAGGDDFLNNPTRPIQHQTPGRGSTAVDVPHLTQMTMMIHTGGRWEAVREGTTVHAGDRVQAIIESVGVDAGTPVMIEVFDTATREPKIPFSGEIQGDRTEIEFELMSYIVGDPPDNQLFFEAWIYEPAFNVASDPVAYVASSEEVGVR